MTEECTHFGYDKSVSKDGYITKEEYDVEACEADMNAAQEYRLDMYMNTYEKSSAKEMKISDSTNQAIYEAAEASIAEIIEVRDANIKVEKERHELSMVEFEKIYERNVDESLVEHEEVIKGLRESYLKDLGLQAYLDTLQEKAYISAIKAEDYKKAVQVKAEKQEKPQIKSQANHVRHPQAHTPVY